MYQPASLHSVGVCDRRRPALQRAQARL